MSETEDELFPLARRRLTRRAAIRLVLGLGLIGFTLFDVLVGYSPFAEAGLERLLLLPLVAGLYYGIQGGLWLAAARSAAVRLTADAVVFPPSIATLRSRAVPYSAIELLLAQGGGGRGRVVVGTRARVHVVDALDIGGVMTLKAFHQRLRHRLSTAGGPNRLERIDRGLELTRRLMSRRARMTEAILILLVVAYVAEMFVGAVQPLGLLDVNPMEMIRMGAIVPVLILEGDQWFRLVTGTVLHAGLVHIAFNGMAILALGGLTERLIGGYRLAIIYIVSALVGSVSSLFVSGAPLAVGASGAVFGLLGAFGVLQLFHGRRLPPGVGQSRRWWLVILGLNAALPLALPMIDVWAHVGGFIGGAAVAAVLLRKVDAIRPDRPAPFAVQSTAMALIGLAAAGLALGADHARDADAQSTRVLRSAIDAVEPDPEMLNMLAWGLVIAPEAAESNLTVALAGADKALSLRPEADHLRDTRATALYRLGRYDEAVAEERQVLRQTPRAYYATQLLRFIEAALAERKGVQLLAGPALAVELPERTRWTAELADADAELRLPDAIDGLDAVMMIAAVRVDGIGKGLAIGHLVRDGDRYVARRADESASLPDGAVIVPLLLDGVTEAEAEAAKSWRVWPVDPAVNELP